MHKALKLAHLCGLVVSLGSIFTSIVVSSLIEGASLEDIALGRKIISTVASVLTLPGMWCLAITGVWMGYKHYGLKHWFFQLKLLIVALILINGYLFVLPAVESATEIAVRSLAQGQFLSDYKAAYMQESTFGLINILLTVTGAAIGVWRVGIKSADS